MVKKQGYQPSNKSELESQACKQAYQKLNILERSFLSHSFRRFYRFQNFGESSLVELVGKLGMHLSQHFPQKFDKFANQLEIGDYKQKQQTTRK